jgi:hypothetical protein
LAEVCEAAAAASEAFYRGRGRLSRVWSEEK